MTTPKTASPELSESQADKEETANEAFRRIEAGAAFYVVVDQTLTAPPGACADGAQHIVAAGGTGAWATHDGQIAIAVGVNAANGWYFRVPEAGVFAWVQASSALYNFDGAAWVLFAAGVVGGFSLTAGAALAAHDLINIYDAAGTPKVRKADASDPTKKAHGFVKAGVLLGAAAQVFRLGRNPGLAGLTGGDVWLDTTAGQVTQTPPSVAGQIVQLVGVAISATEIDFSPGAAIEL